MGRCEQSSPTEAQTRNAGGSTPGPAVPPLSLCRKPSPLSLSAARCPDAGNQLLWSPVHAGVGCRRVPVADAIGAGLVDSDNDEDVLKVGADVLGGERQRPGLLEDDRHDVVSYVPLP